MGTDHVEHFLSQVEGVKPINAAQWIALCPAHADRNPSLSIGVGDGGQIILHCYAGCSVDAVVGSLGMKMQDLWPERIDNISPEERRLLKLEAEQHRQQREIEALTKRMSAIEKIHGTQDHIQYHENLRHYTDALEYWLAQGMFQATIDRFMLGYCPQCRSDYPNLRPSYTIPVISNGKLWNIRHRLIGADSDKYRPHIRDLPNVLFNADDLRSAGKTILLLEGEKKSMCASQHGWRNVAIMGKAGFKTEWVKKFDGFKDIVVALDPDGNASAIEIAKLFDGRARVAALPEKLDDMLNPYGNIGAKPDDVWWFFERARRI